MFLLRVFIRVFFYLTISVCREGWYTDTFLPVQLNREIKKNVPAPTRSNIEKHSRAINIGRRNDKNLKSNVDNADFLKNEWTLPDLRYDIDMIMEFLIRTLGSNRNEAIAETTHNKMSGGSILDKDFAILKVL